MVSTFLTPNTWIPGSGFFTVQGCLTITTPFGQPQGGQQEPEGPRNPNRWGPLNLYLPVPTEDPLWGPLPKSLLWTPTG